MTALAFLAAAAQTAPAVEAAQEGYAASPFDIAALLVVASAVFGTLNHHLSGCRMSSG